MSHCALDSDLSPTVRDFSSNLSCESSPISPNYPYIATGGHRARLEPRMEFILLKREGSLRTSYSLLWRSVGNRVRPLRLGVKELLSFRFLHSKVYGSDEPRTEQAESQGRFILTVIKAGVLPNRQGAIFMLRFKRV